VTCQVRSSGLVGGARNVVAAVPLMKSLVSAPRRPARRRLLASHPRALSVPPRSRELDCTSGSKRCLRRGRSGSGMADTLAGAGLIAAEVGAGQEAGRGRGSAPQPRNGAPRRHRPAPHDPADPHGVHPGQCDLLARPHRGHPGPGAARLRRRRRHPDRAHVRGRAGPQEGPRTTRALLPARHRRSGHRPRSWFASGRADRRPGWNAASSRCAMSSSSNGPPPPWTGIGGTPGIIGFLRVPLLLVAVYRADLQVLERQGSLQAAAANWFRRSDRRPSPVKRRGSTGATA
jgi:hypothetical protein